MALKQAMDTADHLKGIWMAPDFDAQLEDFRDYTE